MHVCLRVYVCTFLGLQGRINELEQKEGDHLVLQQRFESLNKRYTDLQALNSYRETCTKEQHSWDVQPTSDSTNEEAKGEDEGEEEDEESSEDQEDGVALLFMLQCCLYLYGSNDVFCKITDLKCCL